MTEILRPDVIIIGGGIVGTSAALALRRAGRSVVLLEKGFCGAGPSGINFGGVRRQGRSRAQLPIAQRAQAIWGRLPELIGIDGEYVRTGHLKLARSEEDLAALSAYNDSVADFGLELELIGLKRLRDDYPWIGGEVAGASLCPQDGHANPRLVSPAFAAAARRAGADIREQVRVVQVEHEGGRFVALTEAGLRAEAPFLLNCAGAGAAAIAASLGDPTPVDRLYPVMFVTEPLPSFMTVGLGMQGGGLYGRQALRGNCVVGGGRGIGDPGAETARTTREALHGLIRRATGIFNPLRGAQVIRSWTGIEARSPDGEPVIGPGSLPGLVHAFGFSGGGFQIGPAVGEIIAELVTQGKSYTPLSAFRIDRFPTTGSKRLWEG
jgi:sarcosine oxidase subunit beta